jgi:flagellar biosynthesis protein FlhB
MNLQVLIENERVILSIISQLRAFICSILKMQTMIVSQFCVIVENNRINVLMTQSSQKLLTDKHEVISSLKRFLSLDDLNRLLRKLHKVAFLFQCVFIRSDHEDQI